jgi:hypothetical protein
MIMFVLPDPPPTLPGSDVHLLPSSLTCAENYLQEICVETVSTGIDRCHVP